LPPFRRDEGDAREAVVRVVGLGVHVQNKALRWLVAGADLERRLEVRPRLGTKDRTFQNPPQLYKLVTRFKRHGEYERTRYGRTRASPSSFVTQHTQQISKTAVVND